MSIAEILLLILGAVIFAAGFIVPEMKEKSDSEAADTGNAAKELEQTAERLVDDARKKINETVIAECSIAQDDAARAMEKLSNEKIMAINEYGKTVLDEIEKNHKEVVFLYEMLNEKTADIKNTVRKVDSVNKAVPFPSAKDRPALKAAIATGVGRNGTAAVTKHENAVKEERKAAYGVTEKDGANENHDNSEVSFKIPKMFAPKSSEKQKPVTARKDISEQGLNEKIMELHNDGVSDVDIARQFGIGVGEVRLKIGLMEAKQV